MNGEGEQVARYPGLHGKRALVTGGSRGIGLAIVEALLSQGVIVTAASRTIEPDASRKGRPEAQRYAVAMDVSDRNSVQAGFDRAMEAMGGLDILVANAGVSTIQGFAETRDEDWDFNMDVNAKGTFITNQIAANHFLKERTGTIVNVSSFAGKIGLPLLGAYSASKFAVIGWTQALARELGPANIRVNAVCPGYVDTSMQERELKWEGDLRGMSVEQVRADYISQTPLGRIETPQEVADTVVFLCSGSARFMTGQSLNVTGGVYIT